MSFGRFTVAVLHSLLSLAALSANVASGLPTTANGPDLQAAAGASVAVEADGSVLVRLLAASKGDGELHRGALEDGDGVRTRVVFGADDALDGRAADAFTGVDGAETDESLRMVRRIDVALVDARSKTAMSKAGSLWFGIVVCVIAMVCQCVCIYIYTKPKREGLLEPSRRAERQATPPRNSLAESVCAKDLQAPPKGNGKNESDASDDEGSSKAAPDIIFKGKGKGKGKEDSNAPDDDDSSKAAPDPQAPDADTGKEAPQAPDGAPPTNDGGLAGAPSPPQPEESSSDAVACNEYRVDMTAAKFGACKCGFLKAEHKKASE